MEQELFNDLIESCKEATEHEKGNIRLKSRIIEIPDDEIEFYNIYKKLSETNKQKAKNYVNELLRVSNN